jgi:hypothetical protein
MLPTGALLLRILVYFWIALDNYDYFKERQELLNLWADFLNNL